MSQYSLSKFEEDITGLKPRPFDTYVLPAFVLFYALRSKKPMGRLARRILFTAGVYMTYRSWGNYKALVMSLQNRTSGPSQPLQQEV